jgi:protein-disulfide isomerase
MFKTFRESVAPQIQRNPRLAPKLQVLFRQQVQPWHPSSTLTHEAGLAVQRLAPAKFWDFSDALFRAQTDYFDVPVVREARNDTYRRLARLAAQSTGLEEDRVYGMLAVPDKPGPGGDLNVGNEVTNDMKVLVKMARLVGVHVTPSIILDGVVNPDFSSSWTPEQWLEYLEKQIA